MYVLQGFKGMLSCGASDLFFGALDSTSIDYGFLGVMILSPDYTPHSPEAVKEHGCLGPVKSESLGWDPEEGYFNMSILKAATLVITLSLGLRIKYPFHFSYRIVKPHGSEAIRYWFRQKKAQKLEGSWKTNVSLKTLVGVLTQHVVLYW